MTKKLLIPTRLQRMKIRQEQAESVDDHNRHCEETENNARVENWVKEQQTSQQEGSHQSEEAECSASDAVKARSPSPPPPTLPPRSRVIKILQEPVPPLSQRGALLQQIRELAGRAERMNSTIEHVNALAKIDCVLQDTTKLPSPTDPSTTQQQLAKPKRIPPPVPPKLKLTPSSPPIQLPPIATFPTNPYNRSPTPNPPDPTSSTRTFISNCGAFRTEALLLDWKDGQVWLQKSNGVKVSVPLSRLSGHDVGYVLAEMMRRADSRLGAALPKDVLGVELGVEALEGGGTGGESGLQRELEGVYTALVDL